jgi:hypothetical protein
LAQLLYLRKTNMFYVYQIYILLCMCSQNFLHMCEFLSNRDTCMREVDDKWTISYIYII